jgi:hypothetical protein
MDKKNMTLFYPLEEDSIEDPHIKFDVIFMWNKKLKGVRRLSSEWFFFQIRLLFYLGESDGCKH